MSFDFLIFKDLVCIRIGLGKANAEFSLYLLCCEDACHHMGELVFGQFCSGGTKSGGAKTFLFRWEISFAASVRPVNINPIYVLPIGSRKGVAKKTFF